MSKEPDVEVNMTTCHSLHLQDLLAVLGLSGYPVTRLNITAAPNKFVEATATLCVPETQAQALVEAFKQDLNPTVKSIGIML